MTPAERLLLEEELAIARRQIAWDAAKTTADITGIFDPTPASDGVSTVMSLVDGEWIDAGLSAISIFPYIGDGFAKPIKAARAAKKAAALAARVKTIENALNSAENTADALRKLEKRADGSICVSCVQARLQSEAKPGHYVGVVKGKQQFFNLRGVNAQRINYTRRSREEYARLRKEFNPVRKKFLADMANDPQMLAQMKQAGLTDAGIKDMKDGINPLGWEVHHKIPLDDGGTNDVSNLVLMKKTPVHTTFSNAQSDLTKGLEVGQSRVVDFPVPEGFIYPPSPDWVTPITP